MALPELHGITYRGVSWTRRENRLLWGLSNAHHLAQTPFFVNQLVAAGICRLMFACTDELISQPDSPNLYRALTALPDSLLELKRAASLESSMFELNFLGG